MSYELTYEERARAAGAILFSSGIPSNFHRAPFDAVDPIRDRTRTFETVEHFFQAAKVVYYGEGSREMYDEIADASSPAEAKRLGRAVPLVMGELADWNREALMVMLEGCLGKFMQVEECRAWLVATRFRPLVEHRLDPVWGDNMDGRGRNLLGKTLELVRAAVR